MVEPTTRWLETYSVPHATGWNIILGLEKQGKNEPQKELSQTMAFISEATSLTFGSNSVALNGYITPPTMHQPSENWTH